MYWSALQKEHGRPAAVAVGGWVGVWVVEDTHGAPRNSRTVDHSYLHPPKYKSNLGEEASQQSQGGKTNIYPTHHPTKPKLGSLRSQVLCLCGCRGSSRPSMIMLKPICLHLHSIYRYGDQAAIAHRNLFGCLRASPGIRP